MHGSQSFASAIGLAISIRSFSVLSFIILLLWSLSPLGGQSSLRLLAEANATAVTSQAMYFPNQDAESGIITGQSVNQVSVIVASSISTADTLQNSSVDAWNHPKIPRLRQLELARVDNDQQHPWIDTQNDGANVYTPLTGLSVVGLEADTVADFTIPYAYMYTDCKAHMRASAKEVKAFFDTEIVLSKTGEKQIYPSGWPYASFSSVTNKYDQLFNVSYLAPSTNFYYESSFFLVSPFTLANLSTSRYVFYGTKDTSIAQGVSLYKCTLHDVELEASIVCRSAACRTARLRRTNPPRPRFLHSTSGSQPWKLVGYDIYILPFIRYFPTLGGTVTPVSYHPIDSYIFGNPNMAGAPTSYFNARPAARNWSALPDEQVSQRLTEIFNTYWEASRWAETTMRADPFAISSINTTSGEPFAVLNLNKTIASVTRQELIYKASLPWVLTLILCSGTLFMLGLVNVSVAMNTCMPDILGAVSSLTRDNPHVDLPAGGSGLDGMERTRLIKDMRVQLCDVQAEDEVGRIALKSIAKSDPIKEVRLERDRLYN